MSMASAGRRVIAFEALLAVVLLVTAATIYFVKNSWGPHYTTMDDAEAVPAAVRPVAGASTGSYRWNCGRNERGHRNTANIVVTPGKPGPAHHLHDYIGNLGVQVDSTVADLVGKPTTCSNGDASTYYWAVLRLAGASNNEHGGPVQVPVSLTMTYYGNPLGPVLPMPRLLRAAVGDAYAHTNGGALARSRWTCSDTPERQTMKYPLCDDGAAVVRIFDFPSCWDGRQLGSANHRQHVVFPVAGGGCPVGTFAVPRLQITMAYAVPRGTRYQIDAFDDQDHDPATDHGFLVNLMPEPVMARVVKCLNSGRACDDTATKRSAP